jgi:hypothetical protein
MKPRIALSSSLAQTMKTSASGALEIQFLLPDSFQPPGTLRARVARLPGSEPEFGSVRPKQPIHSPLPSLGRYFASVPRNRRRRWAT